VLGSNVGKLPELALLKSSISFPRRRRCSSILSANTFVVYTKVPVSLSMLAAAQANLARVVIINHNFAWESSGPYPTSLLQLQPVVNN